MKVKVAILKNELPEDHFPWINACEERKDIVEFGVVDITKDDWLEHIENNEYQVFLAKPTGLSSMYKQLYDERIKILDQSLGKKIYPSPLAIYIHENKRFFYSWAKANQIPVPETHIFYHKEETEEFIKKAEYPIVAKLNIGASGSGVNILSNRTKAKDYINKAFSNKGLKRRWGPNFEIGNLFKRGIKYLSNLGEVKKKAAVYSARRSDTQKGYVIFQEFIPHDFEWRIVRISESLFAHKKLKKNQKASGTLLKDYSAPPLDILDFVKEFTDRFNFKSMAVDLFITEEGDFKINEAQCMFGQSDSFQMKVNGKVGRYRFINDEWIFEEGDYAKDACYPLRLEYILSENL